MNEQPSNSKELSGVDPEDFLRCVACGYNLFGLGDEPRCPECGLLNVPATYRKQVQELVDSGKWFYSGFFSPFKKRLPGWWWSLDREGDVKKSFRYAAINLILSALIILLFGGVVGLFHVETRTHFLYRMIGTSPGTIYADRYIYVTSIHANDLKWSSLEPNLSPEYVTIEHGEAIPMGNATSSHVVIRPSWIFLIDSIPWILFVWCMVFIPVYVGLFTQVRKGLPEYARPSRTILVAGNLESHRLIYVAMWLCVEQIFYLAGIYAIYHRNIVPGYLHLYAILSFFAPLLLFNALGWVGSLRSDYTKQLVRSRWHALRIIVMYALVLPVICYTTASGAIDFFMKN